MFMRSERLFLRPGWPEDLDELYMLLSDEDVVRNLARDPWPLSVEDARDIICRPRDRLLPHLFITVPGHAGARLVGSIGLGRDGDEVELGYWIAKDHRGRGYATEAVRAMLNLSRALGHKQLLATHYSDNPGSFRVLEKAGFRRSGGSCERSSTGRDGPAPATHYSIALDCLGCDADVDGDGDGMKAA